MKIALIYPSKRSDQKQMPLGIGYIASYILSKNEGIEVKALDTGIATEKETKAFYSDKYDIVGISVTSKAFIEAVQIAKTFKEISPAMPIIFGGPHVSIMRQEIMEEPLIDLAVYSEGELTFDELVKALRKTTNRINAESLAKIRGLIYRDGNRIVVNPPREFIQDLDALPFPAFHLFPMGKYPGKYPMITSRGCPFACVFCASSQIWCRKWRARSPENIIAEMEYLTKNFGLRPVDFHDDGFNMSLKRVNDICGEFINKRIKIPWGVRGFRADIVEPDVAKKMRKAGCTHVAIGVESANPEMLKRMGKKESIAQIARGTRIIISAGIDVIGQFMIGNPGETLETVKESIEFAKKSCFIKAVFGTAVPFPGTGLWNYVEKHGRFLIEPDCTRFEEMEPRIIFETPEFNKQQRLEALKLVAEAGMLPPMKQKAGFVSKMQSNALNLWFRFLNKHLPPSVSYRLYFFLRRLRAILKYWIRRA